MSAISRNLSANNALLGLFIRWLLPSRRTTLTLLPTTRED
jgi:hypothetical protein